MATGKRDFSVTHVLALVLVVVLAGVAGWLAFTQNKTADHSDESLAYVSATDSAGQFSFEYPDDWTIKPYVWDACCEGSGEEPDWSKQSKPITLSPSDNADVDITITMENYGDFWDSYEALRGSVQEDYFANILFDGTRDDGHKALFSRVDYLGPPDAKVESFTDHRYYFDNGNTVLKVEFREKYHHDWPDDETGPDIDNTRYLPAFEHIAQSIKLLN